MKMTRFATLLSVLALLLTPALVGCPTGGGDDDDDMTPPPDDDDAVDDDDDAVDDDDAYEGLPDGLTDGVTWEEAFAAGGDEVYSGFTLVEYAPDELPPADGVCQPLGESGGGMTRNVLTGEIATIVAESWDGDNDGYEVVFPSGGYVHFLLEWDETLADDYDAVLYCWYADDNNEYDIYAIPTEPELADLSVPEGGVTTVPLPQDSHCYFFVVGFLGDPIAYTVTLAPMGDGPPPVGDDDDDSGAADDDDSATADDDDSAR
jgi:hypothetical protein